MRKVIFISILAFVLLFALVGCASKTDETNIAEKKEVINVEANTSVGVLKFYVPDDFTYRPDYRGIAYTEEQKKVYQKGDENNPQSLITIIADVSNQGKGAKQYTDAKNESLGDEDVKYEIKSNGKIIEIYAKENGIVNDNVDYSYITDKNGEIYSVYISGPKDKSDEISQLAKEMFSSFCFK